MVKLHFFDSSHDVMPTEHVKSQNMIVEKRNISPISVVMGSIAESYVPRGNPASCCAACSHGVNVNSEGSLRTASAGLSARDLVRKRLRDFATKRVRDFATKCFAGLSVETLPQGVYETSRKSE